MGKAHRSIGMIVSCVVLVCAGLVLAADWPQWRGANRDGKVKGFEAPKAWPKALAEKWKVKVGSGDATPALVGDRLYVFARQGDEEVTLCLNAADGKLLWKLPFAPDRRAYNAATPIVDGQTVIITGGGRGTKALKITKTAEGFAATELWHNAEVATKYNTPVLVNGLLFGFSGRGNLFCLNAKDGKTAWTDSTRRGRGFASIVGAGSVVLALPSNSELIAFKPIAKEFSQVAKIKVAESATYAHPVIAGNRIFVKDKDSLAMLTIE